MTDTSTQSETMTYVCPIKDIVCGDRPENWCKTCPKRTAKTDTSTKAALEIAGILDASLYVQDHEAADLIRALIEERDAAVARTVQDIQVAIDAEIRNYTSLPALGATDPQMLKKHAGIVEGLQLAYTIAARAAQEKKA